MGQLTGGTDDIQSVIMTPFAILFDKVEATKIDFFDFSAKAEYIRQFRENIAMWYYVLRFIATGILLAILVYIGIRMAISTVAEEKAKYKKMIVDWLVSLALLYLLHYIIVFVIHINTVFVEMLSNVAEDLQFDWLLATLLGMTVNPLSGIGGWAALILYVVFVWQTLKFFIMYVKRMITIGFLILISPLITITYSVDRAGDQKAQALNSWLKEFIFNVLIQPFHCILYLSFAQVAFTTLVKPGTDSPLEVLKESVMAWNDGVGNLVFAVLCLVFVNSGEKVIREIFGFSKASTVGDMAGAAAIATGAISSAAKMGKVAKKSGGFMNAMFPGLGDTMKKIGNTNIAQKFKESETGKFFSGIGSGIGNAAHSVSERVKDTDLGQYISQHADAARTKVAEYSTAAHEKFTRFTGSVGQKIEDFKGKHKVATEIFGVGKKGVIKGFKMAGASFKNPDAWKYVGVIQGALAGLGISGSLTQAALFSGFFQQVGGAFGKMSGFTERSTAKEFAKDIGGSVRSIEAITKTEMTEEKTVEQIEKVIVLGDAGAYAPEKTAAKISGLHRSLQAASMDGTISDDLFGRGFTAAHNVFKNGGDHYQAASAMFNELEKEGIHINPAKKAAITDELKDLQLHTANGQLYRAYTAAEQAGVTPQVMAEMITQNKPARVPEGETDPETISAYNESQNMAARANSEFRQIRKELEEAKANAAETPDIDSRQLISFLQQLASQIIAYQNSGHVNEVVIREMVNTYNVTAHRTNELNGEFDLEGVKRIAKVQLLDPDRDNPGKFKLVEDRTTSSSS